MADKTTNLKSSMAVSQMKKFVNLKIFRQIEGPLSSFICIWRKMRTFFMKKGFLVKSRLAERISLQWDLRRLDEKIESQSNLEPLDEFIDCY